MSDVKQYVQITFTRGVQVTIPFVGSLEAGIALNEAQLGAYVL